MWSTIFIIKNILSFDEIHIGWMIWKKHQFLVYFMSKYQLFLHLAFTAPLSFIITINVANTNIFNQNISSIDENECRDSIRWWKFGCQTLIIFWHFKLKAKKNNHREMQIKKHRILIHVIQFLTLWQEWRLKKYHLAFRCILNISSVIQRITYSMELFILPHTIQIQFPWIE